MGGNMANKILRKCTMWLNGLSLFSNKINGKHYNKQNNTIKQVTVTKNSEN